jgi:hypothetical protein
MAQAMLGFADKYSVDFSNPFATMVVGHCGTKYYTNLVYTANSSSIEFMIYMLDNGWLVFHNEEKDEQTVMVMGEDGLTVTYPDGTVEEIPMDEFDAESMSAIFAIGVPDSWFGEEKISYDNVNDLYIFYDKATGEYEIVSSRDELHDYVLDESKSVINDECGTSSYYHYVCDECGAAHGTYRSNYHDIEWKYVLPEGVNNCEDGLYEIEYCAKCNEVMHTNEIEYGGHYSSTVTIWNADEKSLYTEYECACGYDSSRDHQYTVDFDGDVEFG